MPTAPHMQIEQRLGATLALCRKMNSEHDLNALLDLVVRESVQLLGCDRASIFLLDEERNELWSKVALGSDEILRLDAQKGIVGSAVQTREIVNVSDVLSDSRFYHAVDARTGYQTRNALAAPMFSSAGSVTGVFEAINKPSGPFDAWDEECLSVLAAHAAVAVETAQLVGSLRRSQDELVAQNTHLWREVSQRYSAYGIIGASHRIEQVVRLIERIRDSLVNVLITGESGAGKELAAKAVHFTSSRARKPFVALNCAALPEPLVESELFGIERGVATGVQPRIGHFQRADGGTLFLDEIGDLSLTAQAKILRVLQERVVERVGGRGPVPVDVRLVAATNRDLEAAIAKGEFREDLYYRINVVHIHMPPLREMRDDIPLLAQHFLAEYCRDAARGQMQFSAPVMRRLRESNWPGNARQLRNEVMRLAACSTGSVVTDEEPWRPEPSAPPCPAAAKTLHAAVAELEQSMIREALALTGDNQQQAARRLGLSRQGLINKMKRYGIL